MNQIILLADNFVALFVESAPWLLLGLLVAGLMHELVPVDILKKHMGANNFASVSKAAIIGAPLPLCSCGVIPAAIGLRRSGASKSSTISFLVSTPETGVDSVSVSYALLGPVFAVVRPIAAIISAMVAGIMVMLFGKETEDNHANPSHSSGGDAKHTCCASSSTKSASTKSASDSSVSSCSEPKQIKPSSCSSSETESSMANCDGATEIEETSCCASTSSKIQKENKHSWFQKTVTIMQFSSGKLLRDITFWLMLGLVMAAAIQTFVPSNFLTQWGDGFIAMLVMALIGVPMYICATASTPLALGFLAAGLSPGAILVFMMAGPATNIATMGMIAKEMGTRTLVLYLTSVITTSILFGYGLNTLFAIAEFSLPNAQMHAHEHSSLQWLYLASAVLLATLIVKNAVSHTFQFGNKVVSDLE